MDMTPKRWIATREYINRWFGDEDDVLRGLMPSAIKEGLPDIAVDAGTGRMLSMLCAMTGGGRGARTAIEVGTLGGYSAIWIARALGINGRLFTIEAEPSHAAFARRMLHAAGVADRTEVIDGRGLEALPRLISALGSSQCVDFVFLDAIKTEYPGYFGQVADAMRPGGLIVADNTLGSGSWWVDGVDPGLAGAPKAEAEAARAGAHELCRSMAADERFECGMIPIREGLLIGRRKI